jgi:hypothetical protein
MSIEECQATVLAEILNGCFHELMAGHSGVNPCEVITKFARMNLASDDKDSCHCNGIEFVQRLESELKINGAGQ